MASQITALANEGNRNDRRTSHAAVVVGDALVGDPLLDWSAAPDTDLSVFDDSPKVSLAFPLFDFSWIGCFVEAIVPVGGSIVIQFEESPNHDETMLSKRWFKEDNGDLGDHLAVEHIINTSDNLEWLMKGCAFYGRIRYGVRGADPDGASLRIIVSGRRD